MNSTSASDNGLSPQAPAPRRISFMLSRFKAALTFPERRKTSWIRSTSCTSPSEAMGVVAVTTEAWGSSMAGGGNFGSPKPSTSASSTASGGTFNSPKHSTFDSSVASGGRCTSSTHSAGDMSSPFMDATTSVGCVSSRAVPSGSSNASTGHSTSAELSAGGTSSSFTSTKSAGCVLAGSKPGGKPASLANSGPPTPVVNLCTQRPDSLTRFRMYASSSTPSASLRRQCKPT
mmetsp:Transcript_138336/g.345233  ORF Transcript_138336/g.345233 Transcript_138336/m.345233 type:complete len:232 (-) Transcript_138336:472-1167(-)